MIDLKKITGFALLLSLLIVACKPGIDPVYEKQINEMNTRIDSSLALLIQIDTAKSLEAANHFFENIRYIQIDMKDTIRPELARFIDRYYSLRKAFRLFGKRFPLAYRELTATQKQLNDLAHDAKAGLLDEAEMKKYLQLEGNNLSLAEENASEILEAITTVLPMYDEMNPKIDSLIEADRSRN